MSIHYPLKSILLQETLQLPHQTHLPFYYSAVGVGEEETGIQQ
jgi:hypothetical protein